MSDEKPNWKRHLANGTLEIRTAIAWKETGATCCIILALSGDDARDFLTRLREHEAQPSRHKSADDYWTITALRGAPSHTVLIGGDEERTTIATAPDELQAFINAFDDLSLAFYG